MSSFAAENERLSEKGGLTKPGVFLDLTSYISNTLLEALDEYLIENGIAAGRTAFESKHDEGRVGVFSASSRKHADAIEMCDRDTSVWCMDTFVPYSSADDFKQCRAHREDCRTWKSNQNAFLLPGVTEFVKSLPFFSSTGKVAIIINKANDKGVEHQDHDLDDLVSEFVWIRTKSSRKRFFVIDPVTGERMYAGGDAMEGPVVGWFDDHLLHSIDPVNDDFQWSIRVDGRFTDEFRQIIATNGVFAKQGQCTEGDLGLGLKGVFLGQTDGPMFLKMENQYESESEPEYDEEEEEEEVGGEEAVGEI